MSIVIEKQFYRWHGQITFPRNVQIGLDKKGQIVETSSAFQNPVSQSIIDVDPATRLPLELINRIFLFVVPNVRFVRPDRRVAPLNVCQVSRHWRNIALSQPRLWASLLVYAWRPDLDYATFMQTWLARARSCRLCVTLIASPGYDVRPCMESLLQFEETLKDVRVSGVMLYLMPLKRLGSKQAPALRRLVVHVQKDVVLPDTTPWTNELLDLRLPSASPGLTEYVANISHPLCTHHAVFEGLLSQTLTRLVVTGDLVEFDHFIALQQCKNLLFCELNLGFFTSAPVNRRLVLPSLQELKVRVEKVWRLLTNLVVPCLRVLDFGGPSFIDPARPPPDDMSLSNMIRNSGCSLLQLAVADSNSLSDLDLAQSLCLCPELEDLGLEGGFCNISPDNATITTLTESMDDFGNFPGVVPNLRHITFGARWSKVFTEEITDMLHSVRPSISITRHNNDYLDDSARQWIMDHEDNGDIEIT